MSLRPKGTCRRPQAEGGPGTPRQAGPRRTATARGFTLVELMVTLTVMAIGLGLAAPSFTTFLRNAELSAAANELLGALNLARSEAMKSSAFTYVEPKTSGTWSGGWRVYADRNGNAQYDAGTDTLLAERGALSTAVTLVTNDDINGFADGAGEVYVSYNGSGFPRSKGAGFTGGALQFQVSGATTRKRLLVLNLTGRSRVCDPDKDSTCTASN